MKRINIQEDNLMNAHSSSTTCGHKVFQKTSLFPFVEVKDLIKEYKETKSILGTTFEIKQYLPSSKNIVLGSGTKVKHYKHLSNIPQVDIKDKIVIQRDNQLTDIKFTKECEGWDKREEVLKLELILYGSNNKFFDNIEISMPGNNKIINFKHSDNAKRLNDYFNIIIQGIPHTTHNESALLNNLKTGIVSTKSDTERLSAGNKAMEFISEQPRKRKIKSTGFGFFMMSMLDKDTLPEGMIKITQNVKHQFIARILKDLDSKLNAEKISKAIELYAISDNTIVIRHITPNKGFKLNKSTEVKSKGVSIECPKPIIVFHNNPIEDKLNRTANSLYTPLRIQKVKNSVRAQNNSADRLTLRSKLGNTPGKNIHKLKQVKRTMIKAIQKVNRLPIVRIKQPKANIKIWHYDYKTHINHPINKLISLMNHFIRLTFKNKEGIYNISECMELGKMLGLRLYKWNINTKTLKSAEFSYPIKEQLLKQLYELINTENNIMLKLNKQTYKFCICKGNNASLIKSLLKHRQWVSTHKKDENLNFLWAQWCQYDFIHKLPKDLDQLNIKICNHLEGHYNLSNKKTMLMNMIRYYEELNENVFDTLPLTFHIQKGSEDPEFINFSKTFAKCKEIGKSVWIIKPGERTNRGYGIQVFNTLKDICKVVDKNVHSTTYIVQKYIEEPLLINGRKFDIRMYGLLTSINGHLKGYFYEDGYIRTSSKEFSLRNLSSKAIHLTNDAIQQKEEDYGKFESGNKLSFSDFQKYINTAYTDLHINFTRDLLSQMKKIVTDTFRATYKLIDPHKRKHTFEIFGYDFMLDKKFKLYLIEVNTNPCLELSCSLLNRLIPKMIDNALKYLLCYLIDLLLILYFLYMNIPPNVLHTMISYLKSNSP